MRSLSVKTTLLVYLSLFLISLGIVFGVSYEIRNQSYKELEKGFTVNLKLIVLLSQINEQLRHVDLASEEYLLTKEDFFVLQFEKVKNSLSSKLEKLAELSKQAEVKDLINNSNEFISRRSDYIKLDQNSALSDDLTRSVIKDESPANLIFSLILALEESNLSELEERRKNVENEAKTAFYVKLLGSLFASIIFSFFLARHLVWPISALAHTANQWRIGDKWTMTSPVSSKEFVYLYEEMRELSHRLNNHYAELVRSNRDLEEFASIVSHDLRGPLGNIGCYSDILLEKLSDRATEEEIKCLVSISSNIQRMGSLVQNLLAYAKIGSNKMDLSRVSLNDVVREVKDLLVSELGRNGAEVTMDELPTLDVDRSQIFQLFQNLFENAIKYKSIETLKIHISAQLKEEDWVISVADNGIGIPKDDLHRVFEIFRRSINVSGAIGVGLGLSIVKRIVERHGGIVWLESILGKGTTVFFTLGKNHVSEDLP